MAAQLYQTHETEGIAPVFDHESKPLENATTAD